MISQKEISPKKETLALPSAGAKRANMAAGLTSDDPSTLLRFIGIEEDTDLETPLRTVGSIRTMIELLDVGGRPELLQRMKTAGVAKLAQRQQIANAVGRLSRRQLPQTLLPGDPCLFLTPWNWTIHDGMAVTATPGAYGKVAWRGGAPDGVVEIGIDTSEAPATPFMTLCLSLDGFPASSSTVSEAVQYGGRETIVRVSLARLGVTSACDTDVHTLTFGVLNSIQRYDRWGGSSSGRDTDDGGTRPRSPLPTAALRVQFIRLPVGALSMAPAVRPRRLLAFGDSIVEGVGVGYRRGNAGDLKANNALHSWVAHFACALESEFSSVGYGRHGWGVAGNGDVPPFLGEGGASTGSWEFVFSGVPRTFDERAPDYIIISLGTNDGLIHGDKADVSALVAGVHEWLRRQRAAVGATTHILVCVPFGGFGGPERAPVGLLPRAIDLYQRSCGGDPRCHLVDLGETAARHLTGFRYNQQGAFDMTPESADGIHPTQSRHEELAQLLLAHIRPMLHAGSRTDTAPPHQGQPLRADDPMKMPTIGRAASIAAAGVEEIS